jgi:hypothetical protein
VVDGRSGEATAPTERLNVPWVCGACVIPDTQKLIALL